MKLSSKKRREFLDFIAAAGEGLHIKFLKVPTDDSVHMCILARWNKKKPAPEPANVLEEVLIGRPKAPPRDFTKLGIGFGSTKQAALDDLILQVEDRQSDYFGHLRTKLEVKRDAKSKQAEGDI